MPLFRLFSIKLFFNFELATPNIVGVRSTACNHGHVLRGCMIMQSTTCPSLIRSESLSPINRLRCYRSVTSSGSVCVLASLTIFALTSGTTKITRLPPSDFEFRKRPIGNSGAFFGSPMRPWTNIMVKRCHGHAMIIDTPKGISSLVNISRQVWDTSNKKLHTHCPVDSDVFGPSLCSDVPFNYERKDIPIGLSFLVPTFPLASGEDRLSIACTRL